MTPPFLPLVPVPPTEMRRVPGLLPVKELKTRFPKRSHSSTVEARSALKRWQDTEPEPPQVRNPDVRIKAIRPTPANLRKLRAVIESKVAPAELVNQKMDPDHFFGSLYSALTAREYMEMKSEYKRRKAKAPSSEKVEKEWKEVVSAAQTAYAAAGLPGLQEGDLDRFAKVLSASNATLTAVRDLTEAVVAADGGVLTTTSSMVASFVPLVEKWIDPSIITTPIGDLCDDPIAEGSFTKHFSRSISLSVKIKYWCPTWSKPWRTCTKTITLAGVSFSIGVNVGYKVNCCGATAWGQAYAQVCATIVGIKVCASCSATITGVAGISRTPVTSGCTYGLGITGTLQCKVAGITIYQASIPFGWTVTGPCPPAGLCD